MNTLASVIIMITRALTLIILAQVIVGYFLDEYNPIRRFLDSVVQPFLVPIRKVLPPMGGFDFSPLVLFFLVEIIGRLLLGVIV